MKLRNFAAQGFNTRPSLITSQHTTEQALSGGKATNGADYFFLEYLNSSNKLTDLTSSLEKKEIGYNSPNPSWYTGAPQKPAPK